MAKQMPARKPEGNKVTHGSVIINTGQTGGLVAHTINNEIHSPGGPTVREPPEPRTIMTVVKNAKVITGLIISVLTIVGWFLVHTHGEKTKVKNPNEKHGISISQPTAPVLINNNQSGGQFAYTINNKFMGDQPRQLLPEARARLIEKLRRYPGEKFSMGRIDGDREALDLYEQIRSALVQAGWQQTGELKEQSSNPMRGIEIRIPVPPGSSLKNEDLQSLPQPSMAFNVLRYELEQQGLTTTIMPYIPYQGKTPGKEIDRAIQYVVVGHKPTSAPGT